MGTKTCPFCAEEIQAEARKCKHCGEFLDTGQTGDEQPDIIEPSIAKKLPEMVRHELKRLSLEAQLQFIEEYKREIKSPNAAAVLWLFLGLHYAYLGKWALQLAFWLTAGGFFVWWLVDLLRLSGLVDDYNRSVAITVLKDIKSLSA